VDRLGLLKDKLNIGLCNITKCCTDVCPEDIHITDNGIIPLKERVVDQFYDPVLWLVRKLFGLGRDKRVALPVVSPEEAPAKQPSEAASS
jgi:succinate dehydrogenase / fumarate reductase iron-sulfur subunit